MHVYFRTIQRYSTPTAFTSYSPLVHAGLDARCKVSSGQIVHFFRGSLSQGDLKCGGTLVLTRMLY